MGLPFPLAISNHDATDVRATPQDTTITSPAKNFQNFKNRVLQVFAMVEGLADGGVKMGLPRNLAIKLAAHTLIGSAKMILESGKHPAELKDDVQSPAGSSIYGSHKLESGGIRGLLIDAVEAASLRSKETGDKGATFRNTSEP